MEPNPNTILADLKGLAVRYMNAHPTMAFRYGIEVPVNFNVTPVMHSGFPGLRFGDDTFLLVVDRMPGGIAPRFTGRKGYLVVQIAHLSEERSAKECAIGEHLGTVTLQLITIRAEEAVTKAANTAAGAEVLRQLLDGTLTAQVPLDARDAIAPTPPEVALKDKVEAIPVPPLPCIEGNRPQPPAIQDAREIGSAFAGMFTDSETRKLWDEIIFEHRPFLGRPALFIGGSVVLLFVPAVPSKLISHLPDGEGYLDEQPAVALIHKVVDPWPLAAAAAFPSLDITTWSPISFHSGWGPALSAGVSHWILGRKEQRIRRNFFLKGRAPNDTQARHEWYRSSDAAKDLPRRQMP